MLETVLTYATLIVAAAIALLNVIAPFTKTDKDNKVLAVLRWIEAVVLKALVPQARAKQAPPKA